MPLYFKYSFLLFFFVSEIIIVKAEKNDFLVLSEIKFIGNKVTKERILLREFPYTLGIPFQKKIWKKF